ncbi:uncharacterized protein LOC132635640 isoform X2 [Lycium barbarum]|uniref:uncharacterized protein LOC132635640 isoform X2 n=1 Tax=Lycium barbarum TaxID=112863 RepID=UPI00293E34E1|nr:uncharacterized protein LOC132635640 isoform X2 [Lycium barbarum]
MENSATSVRTGAISIGLNLPMPVKEKGDCQHFCLRQYVAEMKKKDMQICSPFGSSSKPEEKLPPLDTSDGGGTGSEGVRIEKIGDPATEVIASKQCSAREIEPKSPVANPSNSSTKIAVTEPIPSNDGNDKAALHDSRDSEIDPEKEKSSRNGQRSTSNTSDQIVLGGSKEKALNMRNVKLCRSPSLGSRKGTEKTPKMRLLTDLLSEKVNLETSHANAERFSANTISLVPSETVAQPKDNVSVLENVGKGIKISRKKRNMSQEDASKLGMNLDGKMAKRMKALNQNQNAERSPMEIKVTDSRSGENGSDRERLQSGSRSVKNKHISDKDSGVSRKKHKQAQVVGGYSHQMPLEGKDSTGIVTSGYGANILFQLSHASPSTGKVECRLRNNNELLQGKERDFGLSLNSNKLLEVRHASSHMNVVPDKNLRRDGLSKGKNVVQLPIGMGMVTPQPEKELSIIGKLDRSLNSFRDAQKHVKNDTIQSKNTTNWPLVLQKGNKSCDLFRSNVSECVPSQSSRKGVNSLVPNVFEPGKSLRKAAKSLFRRPHVSETDQSLRKGVKPLVRKTNVPETRQTSRKGMIFDLNQGISQTPPMWQEIQSSSDLLQRGNLQVQKPTETARNQYARSHPQTQSNLTIERNRNGGLRWLHPGSTSFYPVHANVNADVGALRGNVLHLSNVKANSTEMAHVQEMQFKLFGASTQIQQRPSNAVQVSAPVPAKWGLQHGEGPKPVWFPTGQNISFGHDNPKTVLEQPSGSVQKGRTISDIKTKESHCSNKTGNPGVGPSNFKQRPFSPCINHPPIQSILFNGSFLSYNKSSSVHMSGYAAGQSSQQPIPYFNAQESLQPQVQEEKRKCRAPARLGGTNLSQSRGLLRTIRVPESRGIFGASCSKVVPLQDDNAYKSLNAEGCSTRVAVLPVSRIPEKAEKDPPCLFNQNPADIAHADDETYMRTVTDQRVRDKSELKEKTGHAHLDGRKRQRRKERPGRMPLACRAS